MLLIVDKAALKVLVEKMFGEEFEDLFAGYASYQYNDELGTSMSIESVNEYLSELTLRNNNGTTDKSIYIDDLDDGTLQDIANAIQTYLKNKSV